MKNLFSLILTFTVLLSTPCLNAQIKVKLDGKIDDDSFSIDYPKKWKIDSTGRNGSSFYLFAEKNGINDNFGENINLIIQNIETLNLTLDSYTELSESQIKTNGNLIESKRIKARGIDGQRLIYEATLNAFQLKFLQYYFLKNGKAFILTFTATSETYDDYVGLAEKIMGSFKIK